MEEAEEVEEVEAVEETVVVAVPNPTAEVPPLTAAEAKAQATSEGLALQSSANKAGYRGVSLDLRREALPQDQRRKKPFEAAVYRAGKRVYIGNFATAEEAALAVARANSRAAVSDLPRGSAEAKSRAAATSDTVASRQKAAKRAAPPPKPPRTKQARQVTVARPQQAVPPPIGVAPAAVTTAAAPPTAETLLQKMGRVKAELKLDPGLLLVDAIKAANELMEIVAPAGAGLPSQEHTLLATIGL